MATFKVEPITPVRKAIGADTDYSRVRDMNSEERIRNINERVWQNYASRIQEMNNAHTAHLDVFEMFLPERNQEDVLETKEEAEALQKSSDELIDKRDTVNPLEEQSSQPQVITAKAPEEEQTTRTNKAEVTVAQTAAGQLNRGSALQAAEHDFEAGRYEFQMETQDARYPVSMEVTPEEDNKAVLKKMAAAINEQAEPMNAVAVYDSRTEQSRLIVESARTGEAEGSFSVYDTQGQAVSIAGIENVDRQGRDARFVENGQERQSSQNDVLLSNGLQATLRKPSDTPVYVGQGQALQGIAEKLERWSERYNTVIEDAYNRGGSGSIKLIERLDAVTQLYKPQLEQVGVEVDRYGFVSINQQQLEGASDSDVEALTENDGGFFSKLKSIAHEVTRNPVEYADRYSLENQYGFVTDYGTLGSFTFIHFQPSEKQWANGLL